jgi:hypothetical protein
MHPHVGKIGTIELGGEQRRCVIIWREGIYVGVRGLPDLNFAVLHADQVLFHFSGSPSQAPRRRDTVSHLLGQIWQGLRFDARKTFASGPPVSSMGIVGWFRMRWWWYRAVALAVQGRSIYVRRAPDMEAFEVPLQGFVPEDCIEHVLPTLSFSDRLTLKCSLRFAQIPYKASPITASESNSHGLPPGHLPSRNLRRPR